MSAAAFATVALIHMAAVMSPGPCFVVCVRTSVAEGFRTAAALALGFGIGAALWAGAALAGLAVLFQIVPALFAALKLAGGAVLVLIAIMMWRHARNPLPEPTGAPPRGALAAMRLGLITFAANPKTAVFFGAVFVGLVPAEAPPALMAALLAVIFFNETLWYLAVARLFSLPRARAAYARMKAWTDRAFGALIAGFGIKIALT